MEKPSLNGVFPPRKTRGTGGPSPSWPRSQTLKGQVSGVLSGGGRIDRVNSKGQVSLSLFGEESPARPTEPARRPERKYILTIDYSLKILTSLVLLTQMALTLQFYLTIGCSLEAPLLIMHAIASALNVHF